MIEVEKIAGQLIIAGFDGTALPDDLRDDLREGRCGGVVLFARNLGTLDEIRALTHSIYVAAAEGDQPIPFVAIDQEGGVVQRIKAPLTVWPSMREVGATRRLELAAQLGEALGVELDSMGINLNFAPVVDIDTNPDNPVIASRSFGDHPDEVAEMAGSFIAGQTIAGVISCIKHFPGHGDTSADSHHELPVINHELSVLRRRELVPFQRLGGANAPMIMSAHIKVPALDTVHPMTLSEAGLSQLLRLKMRYDGVIISDDLEMAAVADHYSIEEMVTLGLRAGLDIFLICRDRDKARRAFERLVVLASSHGLDRERLNQVAARVADLKAKWLRPWEPADTPVEELPLEKHAKLATDIAERAARRTRERAEEAAQAAREAAEGAED